MERNSHPFGLMTSVAFSASLLLLSGLSGAENLWNEQTAVAEFTVPVEWVENASVSDDGHLWIVLDDLGRAELHEMTRENPGQPVQIVMAGQVVMRFTVVAELDLSLIHI